MNTTVVDNFNWEMYWRGVAQELTKVVAERDATIKALRGNIAELEKMLKKLDMLGVMSVEEYARFEAQTYPIDESVPPKVQTYEEALAELEKMPQEPAQ